MKRFLAVPFGLVAASFVLADAKPIDPVSAKLTKAKAVYAADLAKLDKEMADAFAKAETTARKKGDKAVLDRLKPELVSYELTGALPNWSSPAVAKKRAAARAALEPAYALAVREYTKAGDDKAAGAVQKELDRLKAQAIPVRCFTLVNVKSGLALATGKDDADRGGGLVQEKSAGKPHQQWTFVPNGAAQVYLVRNRQSGHFINIGGAHRAGLQVTLWSFDAAEHNHWLVAREGAHYRLKAAAGDHFIAPADASTDAGVAVVQVLKGNGDEQFWTLTPVTE